MGDFNCSRRLHNQRVHSVTVGCSPSPFDGCHPSDQCGQQQHPSWLATGRAKSPRRWSESKLRKIELGIVINLSNLPGVDPELVPKMATVVPGFMRSCPPSTLRGHPDGRSDRSDRSDRLGWPRQLTVVLALIQWQQLTICTDVPGMGDRK